MSEFKLLPRLLRVIEIGAAVWGLVAFVYYWDPTRAIVKRLMVESPYLYEEIHPRFLKVPVNELITVRTRADIMARRQLLVDVIWGGRRFSGAGTPVAISPNLLIEERRSNCLLEGDDEIFFSPIECKLDGYREFKNLSRIARLEIPVETNYRSVVALFLPMKSNGRVVLYHHGYAGTYHEQYRHLEKMIERGFTVVALNLPGYGDNIKADRSGPLPKSGLETARWVLEPVIVSLNYISSQMNPLHISMIGFSAGGWVTTLAAALDARIRSSYIVASPFPLEFRDTPVSGPQISRIRELVEVANLYDIFIMGSSGDEIGQRQQMHIYNQFDRCCWNNRVARIFELPVKEAVESLGGEFLVKIDRSHARHKVSHQAFSLILEKLNGGNN